MENRDVTFKNLTEEQINAIKVLLGDACNIEDQEEEEVSSFPQEGDDYYFLYSNGDISHTQYAGTTTDMTRELMGNCFKTKEKAKFVVERLKVLHEMKQFAEPEDYKWDGHNIHFNIYYDVFSNVVKISDICFCKSNDIYFKSKEDAKVCIEAVGEDRIKKYYLGIDEEK